MPWHFLIPFTIWGAVWWRFRGGALAALTGSKLGGTVVTRIWSMAGLCAPLAWWGWVNLALIPAMVGGLCVAGWGAFMVLTSPGIEANNFLDRTLAQVDPQPLSRNLIGMAISGVMCMSGAAGVLVWLHGPIGLLATAGGVGFAASYALAEFSPWRPNWGRFANAPTEFGELLTGAWVSILLGGSV